MLRIGIMAMLVLVLAGCGDDGEKLLTRDGAGLPGLGGNLPSGEEFSDLVTKSGKIELTDEMMERYVGLMEALAGVETPTQALLARYKFDWQQWAGLSALIWGSQSRVALEDSRAGIEEALAEARAEVASATGVEKQMAESRIKAYEAQLANMGEIAGASEVDRKNVEVLKRWQDRLSAIRKNR